MINKVQRACILPNSQFDHIISIDTFISDILASSIKRPIQKGILLVDNEKKSNCICQHMFTLDSISMWVGLHVLNSVIMLGLMVRDQH